MKHRRKHLVLVVISLIVIFSQCSHAEQLRKHGKESEHGSDESHNFGQNCMSCHNQGGNEAVREGGWWTVAGSVANDETDQPLTDGYVELWSQPNRRGTLYYTLEIDAKGNFYSEKIIDFNGKCFPTVVNRATGGFESMEDPYYSGGCNRCHGSAESLISVD
jgi:hypothetical protein